MDTYSDEQWIKRLWNQAHEVLDKVIVPMCDIGEVGYCDCYLAGIDCYTSGDEALEERIIEAIKKEYALGEHCSFDAFTPLALIALLIIDRGGQYEEH